MIKYVKGNFFDYEADIRINTVNCVGVMGAGAALQFKKKFPKMYEDYVKACNQGRVKIGLPHVWEDNQIFNSKNLTIINFPTKDNWRNPSQYEYIEKGLIWLRDYLTHSLKTITLPALGCGHGGLDWNIVKKLIEQYLSSVDANVLVFEPESSLNNEISLEDLELLKKDNIINILPNDLYYPDRLKGRSVYNIYLKGNNDFFNKKILSIIVSTKPNDREKDAVLKCIETLPANDFIYLLGYNSSFEIDLVKNILAKQSKVIIVIPYGILELKIRKDLIPLWNDNLITVVSLTPPKQSWKISESINSLKFRFKVPNVVLITNYEYDFLKKFEKDIIDSNNSIFYINYWENKNEFYTRIFAKQIGKNRENKLPNLNPLLEHLH